MQKKIVYGVLDWGLGHASRSIPLIDRLLEKDVQICLASSGSALEVLTRHYPDLPYLELPAYAIHFGTSDSIVYSILRQLPHIQKVIRNEHQTLSHFLQRETAHGILSDNRYGIRAKNRPSVVITHQTHIRVPRGWRFSEGLVNLIHRNYLLPFDEVWIPDYPGKQALAGSLSAPVETLRHRYIGPLSRFPHLPAAAENPRYAAVAVLSGPEPARTRFEQILLTQMQHHTARFALVRGLPDCPETLPEFINIDVYNYLGTNDLIALLGKTAGLICRSGYSGLMDLDRMGIAAVLVPTPGQSEQEYLAMHHRNNPQFVVVTQENFDLEQGLSQLRHCTPHPVHTHADLSGPALASFLAKL